MHLTKPTDFVSGQLYSAVQSDDLQRVKDLCADPHVDVNWQDPARLRTPFYIASREGKAEIVRFLLTLERVDVNLATINDWTPFMTACWMGREEVIEMLLKDPRTDINRGRSSDGATPLYWAAEKAQLRTVKMILGSWRREIVIDPREANFNLTPAEQARAHVAEGEDQSGEYLQIAELLERFAIDPQGVRAEVRRQLGWLEESTGELFALVIFLSDEYLAVKEEVTEDDAARRFFKIALQLPMDLQAVLCNRSFGSNSSIVKRNASEQGFRKYGKDV